MALQFWGSPTLSITKKNHKVFFIEYNSPVCQLPLPKQFIPAVKGTYITYTDCIKYIRRCRKKIQKEFLEIFWQYEQALAKLLEKKKKQFPSFSWACFCCHYGILKNNDTLPNRQRFLWKVKFSWNGFYKSPCWNKDANTNPYRLKRNHDLELLTIVHAIWK